MARETWTDERLDDLKGEMNQRFDQVDQRFDQVDQRFDRVEDSIKSLRDEVKDEIKELRADNKAMLHAMNQGFARVHSNMIIGFATIVAGLIGTAAF